MTQTLVAVANATRLDDLRVLLSAARARRSFSLDDPPPNRPRLTLVPNLCPGEPRPGQRLNGSVVVSCCDVRPAAVLPQLRDCNVESIALAHGAQVIVFTGSVDEQFSREFGYALGSPTVTKILVVGAATACEQVASMLARMHTLRARSAMNMPISVSRTTTAGFVRICFGHSDSEIETRGATRRPSSYHLHTPSTRLYTVSLLDGVEVQLTGARPRRFSKSAGF